MMDFDKELDMDPAQKFCIKFHSAADSFEWEIHGVVHIVNYTSEHRRFYSVADLKSAMWKKQPLHFKNHAYNLCEIFCVKTHVST